MIRFTLLFVLLWPAMSAAQSSGAQAESLFRQGRDLMAAGKIAEACSAFEASQKLEAQVTTLLNLAGCREKNGQLATAWGLFLDAERQTRSATDKAKKQLHDVARSRGQKLEPRVSKLSINVPQKSQIDGLEIVRGKERIDSMMWNRSLPIDGGTYTIVARAPGANAWSTEVTIGAEGDTKTVDIPDLRNLARDVQPVPKPAPPTGDTDKVEEEEPEAPQRSSKTLPILVGAGAVAVLGGAVAFELLGRSTYDDAKAEVTDQARRDSLYDSANTKHHVAQGLAVAGVAGVGVAVWLFLRKGEAATTTASKRVVISPTGIALIGAF